MTLLDIKNLSVEFQKDSGRNRVVDSVSFQMAPGEILGIVGESGSGKSTLMYTLKGLLWERAAVSYDKLEMMDNIKIGMVFQDPLSYLNPGMKVGTQLMETIRQHQHLSKQEAKQEALSLLEQVGIEGGEKILHKYPHAFSGGMRQRAALIRTLLLEPDLLLLDEPFSALDYQTRLLVSDDIGQIIRSEKRSAILVTHDLSEAISLGDLVLVLTERPGRIKAFFPLNFPLENDTALNRRDSAEFKHYFNLVWKEVEAHE